MIQYSFIEARCPKASRSLNEHTLSRAYHIYLAENLLDAQNGYSHAQNAE